MQPIQSTYGGGFQSMPAGSMSTAGAAAGTGQASMSGSTSATSATSTMSTNSTMAATSTASSSSATVHQQVEAFLSSVSQGLGDNQYLKLLIAALIMQVLLGQDGGMQQSGQSGLKALEGLAGGNQNSLYLAIESSTNTTQMQQQSSRLEVSGAIQSMAATDAGQTSTGGQVDVTG